MSIPCWCRNKSTLSAWSSDRKPTEVLQAAAEPINRPRHHDIELALGGIAAKRIESWALVTALCARDAVVLVDLDDFPACTLCGLP